MLDAAPATPVACEALAAPAAGTAPAGAPGASVVVFVGGGACGDARGDADVLEEAVFDAVPSSEEAVIVAGAAGDGASRRVG